MEGDPVVDKLMRPVMDALIRHAIRGASRTDIYNRAYEAVMNSMVVKDIAKTFCPNCEKDTECIHTAELYECQECGEDFAKYIVGRTEQSNSDVSMTQDVLTTIKTSFDTEDFRPYADRHRNKYVRSGPHWPLVLRYPVLFDEYEKTLTRAESAEKRNAELEAAARWVPVEEGYPVEDETYYDVVIRYVFKKPFVDVAIWQAGVFYTMRSEDWNDKDHEYITHYRPRPQPPQEVKE